MVIFRRSPRLSHPAKRPGAPTFSNGPAPAPLPPCGPGPVPQATPRWRRRTSHQRNTACSSLVAGRSSLASEKFQKPGPGGIMVIFRRKPRFSHPAKRPDAPTSSNAPAPAPLPPCGPGPVPQATPRWRRRTFHRRNTACSPLVAGRSALAFENFRKIPKTGAPAESW